MDAKKKKILVISGIASFILVVLFAFLILNHDRETNTANLNQESDTSENAETKGIKTSAEPQESEESVDETKNVNEMNSPFKEVVFNGKRITIEQGDVQVDSEGNVLFSDNFIKNKLNTPVSWEDGTVYLGEQPIEGTDETGTYLSKIEVLKIRVEEDFNLWKEPSLYTDRWDENIPFKVGTEEISKGTGIAIRYARNGFDGIPASVFMDYNLSGKYDTFSANVGVDDEYKNQTSTYIVRFYGDDKLLHETEEIVGGNVAIPVELDISGVIRFSIEIDKQEENSDDKVKFVIGNPVLQ